MDMYIILSVSFRNCLLRDSSFSPHFPFDILFIRRKEVIELEMIMQNACPRLNARKLLYVFFKPNSLLKETPNYI